MRDVHSTPPEYPRPTRRLWSLLMLRRSSLRVARWNMQPSHAIPFFGAVSHGFWHCCTRECRLESCLVDALRFLCSHRSALSTHTLHQISLFRRGKSTCHRCFDHLWGFNLGAFHLGSKLTDAPRHVGSLGIWASNSFVVFWGCLEK